MWQMLNILDLGCTPLAARAGLPQCNAGQMGVFGYYRAQFLAALAPVLQVSQYTGAGVLSCFVHEINVDYCSTQPLPNCLGWNAYNVTRPGQPTVRRHCAGSIVSLETGVERVIV